MPSFAVRYRSRGQLREVRWTDGRLSAEPLVETLVNAIIKERRIVRSKRGAPSWLATLDQAEPAALTILDALYEVGAHIVQWDGDPRGLEDDRSGNEQLR
ncbi:MAG: hypothetical protein QOG30_1167 [Acidimicrobiaceae bacterium]|jgi:hypothetical protein